MKILADQSLAAEIRSKARGVVVPRWSMDAGASRLEQALLKRVKHSNPRDADAVKAV
jgi:hypothetical protein